MKGDSRLTPEARLSHTIDLIDRGKDILYPALEKGFMHKITASTAYRLDVDDGMCTFMVNPERGFLWYGGHGEKTQSYQVIGDGFNLSQRLSEGVEPDEIRVVRADPTDESVTVDVPLPYFMAEKILEHKATQPPGRIPDCVPGEWFIRRGRRLTTNLTAALKSFEIIGRLGVNDETGAVELILRQSVRVDLDDVGKVGATGDGLMDHGELKAFKVFRVTHRDALDFHIHDRDLPAKAGRGKVESADETLRPSSTDEHDLKRRRSTDGIFTRTEEGFPGRVMTFEGDVLHTQDILLAKEQGEIVVRRQPPTTRNPGERPPLNL